MSFSRLPYYIQDDILDKYIEGCEFQVEEVAIINANIYGETTKLLLLKDAITNYNKEREDEEEEEEEEEKEKKLKPLKVTDILPIIKRITFNHPLEKEAQVKDMLTKDYGHLLHCIEQLTIRASMGHNNNMVHFSHLCTLVLSVNIDKDLVELVKSHANTLRKLVFYDIPGGTDQCMQTVLSYGPLQDNLEGLIIPQIPRCLMQLLSKFKRLKRLNLSGVSHEWIAGDGFKAYNELLQNSSLCILRDATAFLHPDFVSTIKSHPSIRHWDFKCHANFLPPSAQLELCNHVESVSMNILKVNISFGGSYSLSKLTSLCLTVSYPGMLDSVGRILVESPCLSSLDTLFSFQIKVPKSFSDCLMQSKTLSNLCFGAPYEEGSLFSKFMDDPLAFDQYLRESKPLFKFKLRQKIPAPCPNLVSLTDNLKNRLGDQFDCTIKKPSLPFHNVYELQLVFYKKHNYK
ncbi:hypothetical protein DFA_08644 [Cavenderia fasciculata]|uniref:Uncharacterized protein n=1 Tax=Cavenderia fasciculata TaxID=261658 RepID=F4Q3J0_CACFS|nr:uncharacterized protein DFA_08644 [Cavenderia fasciculata]EGG17648.1 hypothetical protein DFA_08644 [Cavenderia fasciculata]|eukprot:XP_004356132.1 hypothetical protein DFA_08644 [Cavenderia fasciculata]